MKQIMISRLSACNRPRIEVAELVDRLAESIHMMGLLSPLIVIRDKSRWFWRIRPHRYIVVCGNLRLKALIKLDYYAAPCNIVDATVENGLLYYNEQHNDTPRSKR